MPEPQDLVRDGGEAYMTDADVLSIALGSRAAARELLRHFPRIEQLADAPLTELEKLPHLSAGAAVRVKALAEVGRRLSARPLRRGATLSSSADVAAAYRPRLAREMREIFMALHLDVRNRVMSERVIAIGHLTSALVHPREVFREAIREAAVSVIVLHQHPSQDPEPSSEDLAITRRLAEVGRVVGIPLIDSIVVGGDKHVSLAERGLT